jgi:putative transposase
LRGNRDVVRNGYLPKREALTAAGPIPLKVPKFVIGQAPA